MVSIVSFLVIAVLLAIALWALGKFTTLDSGVVNFIRVVIYVFLTLLALNVILVLLFGQGLPYYLRGVR